MDPEFHTFHRKRHQRVRAALRDALRRRSRWLVPVSFTNLFGARQASHWSKTFKRWPQVEEELRKGGRSAQETRTDYELSPGEKRWKKHMQAEKGFAQSDPYRAVFGRSFNPRWPSMLESVFPKENNKSAGADTLSHKPPHIEASTFSYSSRKEPGKPPVIEAASSKWDSTSNKTTSLRFDPITGRMVSDDGARAVDSLTADSIRSSMGNAPGNATAAPNEADKARLHKLSKDFDENSSTIDEQTKDARQALFDTGARKTTSHEPSDGYSKKPMGIETSYASETMACSENKQQPLATEISQNTVSEDPEDGYSKEPTGMQTSYTTETHECDASERIPLDRELSTNTILSEVEDGYSKQPIGMQTSFSTEQEACDTNQRIPLDEEISTSINPIEVEDGYSKQPIGMQTSYLDEQQACEEHLQLPLDQEISSNHVPEEVEDGYTKDPVGMQTSYSEEQQACAAHKQVSLEQEIPERVSETEVNDGYSKEPMGMQTSYETEREDCEHQQRLPLDEEIADNVNPEKFDDGYTDKPMGMQTSFTHEQEECEEHKRVPLDEEIAAKELVVDIDDGYTNKPIGLQNTFAKEQEEVNTRVRPSLEEEISSNEKAAIAAGSGIAGQFKDGYSNSPAGLQTSFRDEHSASASGRRRSLEEELNTSRSVPRAWKDHSTHVPRGLDFLYGHESEYEPSKDSAIDPVQQRQKVAAREVLENEVEAQKAVMQAYEIRNPYSRHHTSTSRSERPLNLGFGHQDNKIQHGEGDMSSQVAKFANSDKWYKQNQVGISGNNQSNDRLVQEILKICSENGLLNQHNDLQKIQDRLMGKLRSLETQLRAGISSGNEAAVDGPMQTISWAEPPSYKILAYDAGNDALQTVTTTSRFSDKEYPISVAKAMSKVRGPARFVSHFASLQKEGYQAIHASDNLLVLRKVEHASAIEDKTATDLAKTSSINPVDGMARQPTETATGNFASPTGFVNHDPVFPIERDSHGKVNDELTQSESEIQDGIYYRHYPRVRRQEPVFSGRRIKHHNEEEVEHRHRQANWRRRSAWKRRVRFALSVGATSAALVYALGVGAELAKGEKERQKREGNA